MNNYIQTNEITNRFNISRSNLYYWVKNKKISEPIRNSTNHYLWEEKHLLEINDVLKKKERYKRNKNNIEYFELNNRRYLGNKYKLIPFIKKIITENCIDCNIFFDVFSGTGVVAESFKEINLVTNDLLYSNYLSHLVFFGDEVYRFEFLSNLIDEWNNIDKIDETNYMSENFGDKYFSYRTATKIGFIREKIQQLSIENKINKREEAILITSLIYGMDKIANTCGHYDAYRKNTIFNDSLIMKFPNIKKNNGKNLTFNQDSNILVKKIKSDIAYIDPPYNSRQYSDAYHLIENIAKWEKPEVYGVAAKMNRSNIKSEYCTKNAPEAFRDLIVNIDSKYILVSYNNMSDKGNDRSNAKINDEELIEVLESKGEVIIFEKNYKAFTTGKSDIENHKERIFLCKNKDYFSYKKNTVIDIASPLNYTGGKYKLLDQIKPLFPRKIDNMIDLFSGGCNVGINVKCDKVQFVDKQKNLIRLFNSFLEKSNEHIFNKIEEIIDEFELSRSEKYGYKYYDCNSSRGLGDYNRDKYSILRDRYNSRNEDNFYYDIIFYVLIVYGFNNQIRYNKSGMFNLPVGKRDFNKRMQDKLAKFIDRIQSKEYAFTAKDFININISEIKKSTFIYADPPYLITNAAYNEQGGWDEYYENRLLDFLDRINDKGIKFALSNVIESKGRRNDLLNNWIIKRKSDYKVHYLSYDYSNSNYQTKNRNKDSTVEVLITNY